MNLQITKDVQQNLDQLDQAFADGRGYEAIEVLFNAKRMVGIALAKALWLGEKYWDNPDETFREYASRVYVIHSSNVKRYIDAWKAILQAPEQLQPVLVKKPIAEIIPIGTNLENGEISPETLDKDAWNKLMQATSPGEVHKVIKEMTGKETEEKLRLYIDMSNGDITSWVGDSYEYIGWLDIERLDVEQVKRSVYRIINKTGIKEKGYA